MRESLACRFHDIRRTFDALLMNLRTFTRYDCFAERRSPFARLRPNDWYQPRADIAWRRHDGSFWSILLKNSVALLAGLFLGLSDADESSILSEFSPSSDQNRTVAGKVSAGGWPEISLASFSTESAEVGHSTPAAGAPGQFYWQWGQARN